MGATCFLNLNTEVTVVPGTGLGSIHHKRA
jgi:hypothetical protein